MGAVHHLPTAAGKLTEAELDARRSYLDSDTLFEPWHLPHVDAHLQAQGDTIDELVARYLREQGREAAAAPSHCEPFDGCPYPATCQQGRHCVCGAVDAALLEQWPAKARRIALYAMAAWVAVGGAVALAMWWPA